MTIVSVIEGIGGGIGVQIVPQLAWSSPPM